MAQVFVGNALWHLIAQSDAICKGVLILLLILSIISWALFLYKWIVIRKKTKDIARAIAEIDNVQSLDELLALGYKLNNTSGGYFINKNLVFLKSVLEVARVKEGRIALTHEERELVRAHADQLIDNELAQEETYLPFFSATAAVSPLLGLFGTVWGLIQSLVGISQKQSADIATVAPGIAEALITTLAGIMVAIPALVMFVYLNTQIKNLEQAYVNLADRFVFVAHRLMHQ